MQAAPPKGKQGYVKLEELLLRHNAITAEQLAQAKEEQRKWGGELGRIFVDLGFISEALLLKATAHQLGIGVCDPSTDVLDPAIVRSLGVQLCERYEVIAVGGDLKKKVLKVATSEPSNTEALKAVQTASGYKIEPVAAPADAITKAIRKYFYGEGDGAPAGEPDADSGAMLELEMDDRRAQPAPKPAAAASPSGGAGASSQELAVAIARIERVEMELVALKHQLITDLNADSNFAGLATRVELLEQVTGNDVSTLRKLGELFVEKGVITREELLRLQKK
jgi:hypothetical protein